MDIYLWVLITSKGINNRMLWRCGCSHYGNNIHGGGISVFIEVVLIVYINDLRQPYYYIVCTLKQSRNSSNRHISTVIHVVGQFTIYKVQVNLYNNYCTGS